MTRQEFIARLRQGLAGAPEPARSELIGDYEAHFDEGAAAGRSEADIAACLDHARRMVVEGLSSPAWRARSPNRARSRSTFATS